MKYFIYILKSEHNDKYYIGSSKDSERRLEYHNTIEKGFTSRYRPWVIVYSKEFESKELALLVEKKIKKWKSKKMVEKIINREIEL